MNAIKLACILLFVCVPIVSCHENPTNQTTVTESILQAVIDSPDVDQFFHIDIFPYRKPLLLTGAGIGDARLSKFGEPVKILQGRELEKYDNDALLGKYPPYYLKVTSIKIASDGKQATVKLDYPAEGVLCSIQLKKNETWDVEKCKIISY